MKIAVCVKEVLDARLPVRVTGPQGGLSQGTDRPLRLINPADRAALEVALALSADVAAFSVCPSGEETALQYALARGVDRVERIEPLPDRRGPLGTALALARRLRSEFDLICCGDETLDNSSAIVGPLLAELLGFVQVSAVCGVREVKDGRAVLVRKLERGRREVVEAGLPLVATFVAEAAAPQYVSQRRLDRARTLLIPVAPVGSTSGHEPALEWPSDQRTVAPRARTKKRFAPDANLSAADRVKAVMSGGAQPPSSTAAPVIEGDTAYVVEQLYRFLKHHEFI